MARRYFVDELPAEGPAVLGGDVAHHLAAVLRCRAGDEVVLADGRGRECRAVVQHRHGRDLEVLAGPVIASPPEPCRVHVAFAPPRWTRAEWLFEHGTEVGVAAFWPLRTERSRPQGERHDRWDKIVRAAAGQCDRAWLPEVHAVREFAAFLQEPSLPRARYLAAPGAPSLPAAAPRECVLLVGPEGGFTDDEQQAAAAAGFVGVGLGAYVLRTETAALTGAAALLLAAQRAQ